jgi:hypothetical protein
MKQGDDYYELRMRKAPMISESSRKTYSCNIRRAVRVANVNTIHDLLMNPEAHVQHMIVTETNLNTLISIFIAIITYMRVSGLKLSHMALYNVWYRHMMEARKKRNELLMNNVPTERQGRTQYPWDAILEKRDQVAKEHGKGSLEHLLLSMFTMVPPRRQWDYYKMRVYIDKDEEPLLDHTHFHLDSRRHGAYMFVNEFKNAKFMGSFFNKEIPERLVKTIRASLKRWPREYLFAKDDGRPFVSVNAFTKFSNGILKVIFDNKDMTVNALRHAHATWTNDKPGVTYAERYRNAIKMGHGVKKDLIYAFASDKDKVKVSLPKDAIKGKDVCFRLDKETGKVTTFPCKSKSRSA